MNAIDFVHPTADNARMAPRPANADRAQIPVAIATRQAYRERDFGVGYGNSSGYADARARRYAETRFQPYFRFS